MKKFLFVATALAALASCSENEFIGDPALVNNHDVGAIGFNLSVPAVTRADITGADAAGDLNKQFIIWGEKNEETDGTKATDGNLVFKNYLVQWKENSANTTLSNTKGWEYVGIKPSGQDILNIRPNGNGSAQTIKYWDYNATNYAFTAVSARPFDIANGLVQFDKIESSSDQYGKGYTITLDMNSSQNTPSLEDLYLSDRVQINRTDGTNSDWKNSYGGYVQFKFRNVRPQIRMGIYETIPGYGISAIKFYVNNTGTTPTQTVEAKDGSTSAFGVVCPFFKGDKYPYTLTVTYDKNENVLNQPIVTPSNVGENNNIENNLILGTNISTVSKTAMLGTTSSAPTWDNANGSFTAFLPQAATADMKLKCDFTLYNEETKETIEVKGATATVPQEYLTWRPNYMYTYLFKISVDNNGQTGETGSEVTGLYPITFDAIEVVDDNGNAEFITTVNEPSITTYAKASAVTTDNEYKVNNTIYVTVEEGTTNVELTVDTNAKLYTATIEEGAAQNINEESVANALKGTESPTGTWTVTDALGKKMVVTKSSLLAKFTSIPADASPSGTELTIKGAKFTPAAAGTYVFEYTKDTERYYKIIKVVDTSSASGSGN